ncbi:glutamate 5-kinase [Candidatus Micrarchaeota archaeon]|nr:glutamate 5-kinase [Candidatus Micrarchaeota archaeon]
MGVYFREEDYREQLKGAVRIVVKIGTKVLTDKKDKLDRKLLWHLCNQLADLQDMGKQVVIVSSGAVACGKELMDWDFKLDTCEKQVAAGIGQPLLIMEYLKLLAKRNKVALQALLTEDRFKNPMEFENLVRTLETAIVNRVIPIINENDVVSSKGFEYGKKRLFSDNDVLASLVARALNADVLIMLSGVDGLLDANGQRVGCVKRFEPCLYELDSGEKSQNGTGGMVTKLMAAESVSLNGIWAVIADGKQPGVLLRIMNGDTIGTLFCRNERKNIEKLRTDISGLDEKCWRKAFRKGCELVKRSTSAIHSRISKH